MEYLCLGIIIDSFSLDGTLKLISKTTNGKMRYQKGKHVFVTDKEGKRIEREVISYRSNGQFDFVKLDGINTKEVAIELKGYTLEVEKNSDDLNEGYYFYSDLEGCKILDEDGNDCGTVKEVEEFPAQITLRVMRKNKPDYFIPFVKAFIINVDIKKKEIKVYLLEGML